MLLTLHVILAAATSSQRAVDLLLEMDVKTERNLSSLHRLNKSIGGVFPITNPQCWVQCKVTASHRPQLEELYGFLVFPENMRQETGERERQRGRDRSKVSLR